MSTIYKIHPAIGVARVGPGKEPYDAPTTAGGLPNGVSDSSGFRDSEGNVNPQAAVFQVYAYDSENSDDTGTLVEVGKDGVTDIQWEVWLANKKAAWFTFKGPNGEYGGYQADHGLRNDKIADEERQSLVLDPGPRSVSSKENGTADFSLDRDDLKELKPYPITSLGSLKASSNGELRVIGADGVASQKTDSTPKLTGDFANNDGWFDTIADGPVNATVMVDGNEVKVEVPAWVMTAPPKFAPQVINLVTLRDTVYDVAVRKQDYNPELFRDGKFVDSYVPNYDGEIKPILDRPALYRVVAKLPSQGSGPHNILEQYPPEFVFSVIRPPDQPNAQKNEDGMVYMPFLAGDNPFYDPGPTAPAGIFLTVTHTQYFLLSQWSKGKVDKSPAPPLSATAALDQGVLENCVGGPFVPGIEITWVSRKTEIYSEPFRIKQKQNPVQGQLFYPKHNTAYTMKDLFEDGVEPGDLSAFMAQPWQSDFNLCSSQADAGQHPNGGREPIPPVFDMVLDFTLWWWAPQRPDWVYLNKDDSDQTPWIAASNDNNETDISFENGVDMVEKWNQLGFVLDGVLVQANPEAE